MRPGPAAWQLHVLVYRTEGLVLKTMMGKFVGRVRHGSFISNA